MSKERIGIMGGSFNPIHERHIALAHCAKQELSLSKILFIPTGNPPHKSTELVGEEHRYEMTRLAVFSFRGAQVSRIELDRKDITYSVDTLEYLHSLYPDANFYFIIGEDSLNDLLQWRKPDELFKLTRFAISARYNTNPQNNPICKTLKKRGAQLFFLSLPPMDISSRNIREQLSNGLVPEEISPQVREYIRIHGLYGTEKSPANASTYYEHLKSKMNAKRFIHSLSVADTARKLARIHNVNESDAATAGELHDCAKCLTLFAMKSIAKDNNLQLDSYTMKSENLLHGPVGAVLASRDYGVDNPNILSAIRCHTTGKVGMLPLDMILYLSDKIEPSRRTYPDLEKVRELAKSSLISAMLFSLRSTINYVRSNGVTPHPMTEKAEAWLAGIEDNERKIINE